jgi:LmbE family N-acetylglucosaminyl deacetylase
MLRLIPEVRSARPLRILCIGAHSDDIEIGCGGTVLTWLASNPAVEVTWVVLSAQGARAPEARRSAGAFLKRSTAHRIFLAEFRDGFFPAQYPEVKSFFESLKGQVNPDIVLTHWMEDRHQDHRLAAELTWNTWRNHVLLEYEIPKYEGDLGQPNAYVAVPSSLARRKVNHLSRYFLSQRGKDWFVADNFLALMRVRGMECRSASGFAEAFHARKLVI